MRNWLAWPKPCSCWCLLDTRTETITLGLLQLVGRPAGEGALLALATQLEAARPWAARRPELASQTSV
jgi:hypothetical protein